MKKIAEAVCLAAIACLVLPLYGCAGLPSQGQSQEGNRPSISVTKNGSLPLEQLGGKKVFVAFKNSSKLTALLADRVTRAGGEVVQSEADADVRLTGEGLFAAQRLFGGRRASADVGEVFEKSGHVETKNKSLNIVLSHGGPVLSAGQATVLANFAEMVGEATGFKGWFNNLVAGDPDGFCFKGCEYRQGTAINLEMRGRDGARIGAASVTAGTEDRKLLPLQLIEAALGEMLSEFGDSQPKTSEAEARY